MKKYDDILKNSLKNNIYFTNEDLRINKKYGFMLSRKELDEYLLFKDLFINDIKIKLPLKSFNFQSIYYFKSTELENAIDDYFSFFINDFKINNSTIISNNKEIILSRLASELEGTLKIEGVNTTRKKILEIAETKNITNLNEQIIYNMLEGYKYISSKPKFNKENLLKLYKILSYKSLKEEDELNGYYRNEMVEVGGHNGCPIDEIEECMDSLFEFVNSNINKKIDSNSFLLPFIAHYYILYIHPYIDFNGRTARITSL